jgi:hypothetical protein
MFTFCLYINGSMAGDEIHNANDDCAICKAWTKKQAIKKFKGTSKNSSCGERREDFSSV